MKLPRDLSGYEFARSLKVYGYSITRQTGSHMRLTTQENGEHHLTIPNSNPMRIGTLASILANIAQHFEITSEEVRERLFG